jgi:hypothetical protein
VVLAGNYNRLSAIDSLWDSKVFSNPQAINAGSGRPQLRLHRQILMAGSSISAFSRLFCGHIRGIVDLLGRGLVN